MVMVCLGVQGGALTCMTRGLPHWMTAASSRRRSMSACSSSRSPERVSRAALS